MKFSAFSDYLQKLETTSSMLEMTAILADLFGKARPDEIRQVVYLSLGEMAPLYEVVRFNLAEKIMAKVISRVSEESVERVTELFKEEGDLGEVIEKLEIKKLEIEGRGLSVGGVYKNLLEVAREERGRRRERLLA